jgi:hypothetical protein
VIKVVSPADRCPGADGVAMDKFCSFADTAGADYFREKSNSRGARTRRDWHLFHDRSIDRKL